MVSVSVVILMKGYCIWINWEIVVFDPFLSNMIKLVKHWSLFVFTVGNNNGPAQQWMLIDKIIQQVILQNKEGDPDVAPLELDVKKIIKQ